MGDLQLSHVPAGQTDGVDLVGKHDGPSHVQQSDVPVQILPPVVLGVDDDIINRHDLLDATLKPGKRFI